MGNERNAPAAHGTVLTEPGRSGSRAAASRPPQLGISGSVGAAAEWAHEAKDGEVGEEGLRLGSRGGEGEETGFLPDLYI